MKRTSAPPRLSRLQKIPAVSRRKKCAPVAPARASRSKPTVLQRPAGAEKRIGQTVHAGEADIESGAGYFHRVVLAAILALNGKRHIPGDALQLASWTW